MMPEKKNIGLVLVLLLASVLSATTVSGFVPHTSAQPNGTSNTIDLNLTQLYGPDNHGWLPSSYVLGAILNASVSGNNIYLNISSSTTTTTSSAIGTVSTLGNSTATNSTSAG